MTYTEAIKEMTALANGDYWTLKHETTPGGIEIRGYIGNGHAWALPAATYAEAIENVKRMLGLIGSDPAPEDDLHVEPITTKVRLPSVPIVDLKMTADNIFPGPVRELDPGTLKELFNKTPDDDRHIGQEKVTAVMTVRELDPAVIEETMTKDNEEYKRRGE